MKKTDALARLLRKRLAYSIACFALFSLCLVPMWMLGKKFFLLGFVVLALCFALPVYQHIDALLQLKSDRGVIGCGHLVQVTQGHAHRSLDMTTNFTDAKGNKRIGKMWVGYAFHVVEVRAAVEDNKPKIKIGETVYEDMYFEKEYACAEAFLVDSVPNNQQILFDLL